MGHGQARIAEPGTTLGLFRMPIFLAAATIVAGTLGGMLTGAHAVVDGAAATVHEPMWSRLCSAVYHSIQLLLLHGPHQPDVHPLTQVARFTGAASAGWAAIAAAVEFFRSSARRGHVVICGLGDLGLRLAVEARKRGLPVVAIEIDPRLDGVVAARTMGIEVVEGDAKEVAVLRRAKIERAESLIAVCRQDDTNRDIVLAAARLLAAPRRRRKPLVARLLIRDPAQRKPFLDAAATAAGDGIRIVADELDLEDAAARQALRNHPLDFRPILAGSATRVRVVVVGFGAMGRAVALHAARIGCFANQTSGGPRTRISVVDAGAVASLEALRRDNAAIDAVCEVDVVPSDGTPAAVRRALEGITAAASAASELVTVVACLESTHGANDRENLDLAYEVAAWADERPVQVLAYQSSRRAHESMLRPEPDALAARIHPFGMVDSLFTWDVLLHESEDVVARALHEDYRAERARDVPPTKEPPWEELPPGFKDSNRQAADHIPIKLRALGYYAAPIREDRPPLDAFTKDETEVLAKLEHLRWCAERRLAGWTWGPTRDRDGKKHPSLVAWEALPDSERAKDRQLVAAIRRALGAAGLGVYR